MKIALYYPWVHLKSGVERTILNISSDKNNSYTIFTNRYDREATYPKFKKLNIVELKNVPTKRDLFSTLKAAITIVFQKIDLSGYDLLIVNSEGLGDLITLRAAKIPKICLCYTPLRPVFDPDYKKRAFNRLIAWQKPIFLIFEKVYKICDRMIWKKYEHIIFISKESLNRAKKGGLIGRNSNYSLIHPGVDWFNIYRSNKFNKYFLLPGRIMWTKNIELAIDAFSIFSKKMCGYRLIIAGMVDAKSKIYFQTLKKLANNNKNIQFVINPTDSQMNKLYDGCWAVLATSFNEDWGLTPIEANAYGKPVIAVNRGGFKETQINGKTGFLVAPEPKEFSLKMSYLASHPGRTKIMGNFARKNSRKYSWANFNQQLFKILKNVQ